MHSLILATGGVFLHFIYGFMRKMKCRRGDLGGEEGGAGEEIQKAGDVMYARGKMTPEEEKQYVASFGLSPDLIDLFRGGLGLQESKSPIYQNLYNQFAEQAKDPYAGWQSSLAPSLALANQNVNAFANQRGLLNSGINIENMGTAGLELAIQDAQNRMNYGQQSLSNAGTFAQNNIANLANLYGQQQGFGQQALGRQAGQAQQAAMFQAYPYQAALGNYYGGKAAAQALPGQIIGAAGQIGAAAMMPTPTYNYYG